MTGLILILLVSSDITVNITVSIATVYQDVVLMTLIYSLPILPTLPILTENITMSIVVSLNVT